jgi:hypothetical protein
MARRRRQTYFFETFNPFVDLGIRTLSRAEIVAYLILLRDTKPDGTARTSLGSIAARGGISRRQAIRAVQALVGRGAVEVVRHGGRGIGATTYCVVPGGIEVSGRSANDGDAGVTRLVT